MNDRSCTSESAYPLGLTHSYCPSYDRSHEVGLQLYSVILHPRPCFLPPPLLSDLTVCLRPCSLDLLFSCRLHPCPLALALALALARAVTCGVLLTSATEPVARVPAPVLASLLARARACVLELATSPPPSPSPAPLVLALQMVRPSDSVSSSPSPWPSLSLDPSAAPAPALPAALQPQQQPQRASPQPQPHASN